MDEGRRADVAPRKLSGRGLSYWTDGKGDERIVFYTIGYRLVQLNARTGRPVASFGKGGVIDLKEGVVFFKDKQIPLETGEIGVHSTPLIVDGAINIGNTMGGVNWPGSGFDPETGIFYTHANNSSVSTGAISKEYFAILTPEAQAKNRIPIWESPHFGQPETPPGGGRGGAPAEGPGGAGGGRGASPLTAGLQGLPIVKPPYGVISAIDLKDGTLKFQVPHGDTPDAVRNSPALKGMTIPKTGQTGIVGIVITKTLVIASDPMLTSPPGRPRGAMLGAYDKETGHEVGAVWLPAAQSGSPMTYMVDSRQFIVVAVGGGTYSSEYIAFALPQAEVKRITTEASK